MRGARAPRWRWPAHRSFVRSAARRGALHPDGNPSGAGRGSGRGEPAGWAGREGPAGPMGKVAVSAVDADLPRRWSPRRPPVGPAAGDLHPGCGPGRRRCEGAPYPRPSTEAATRADGIGTESVRRGRTRRAGRRSAVLRDARPVPTGHAGARTRRQDGARPGPRKVGPSAAGRRRRGGCGPGGRRRRSRLPRECARPADPAAWRGRILTPRSPVATYPS